MQSAELKPQIPSPFCTTDEEPDAAEIVIKTEKTSVEQAVEQITAYLREQKLINY